AHSGCATVNGAGLTSSVTASTPLPTARPRTIAPSTYATYMSRRDNGGSSTKIRLPVIFDWISDDDAFAKAFCSTDIMTRRGTRDAVERTCLPQTASAL